MTIKKAFKICYHARNFPCYGKSTIVAQSV